MIFDSGAERDRVLIEGFREYQQRRDAIMGGLGSAGPGPIERTFPNQCNNPAASQAWSEFGRSKPTYRGVAYEPSAADIVRSNEGRSHAGSPAQDAIGRLGETVDKLHDRVRLLRHRLEPLLSPAGPACDQSGANGFSNQSPLTDAIHGQATSIEGAIEILQDVITRLEL